MLRRSLRANLTSKSIGDPKACKAKQDPVDERGNTDTDKYWIILLMNIPMYMISL